LAIATMITGFDQFSTEPDTQLLAYSIAADGYREDAVRSACKRFIRGEVKGHKAGKLPTVAEFSIECKSEHSVIDASDWRARRQGKITHQSEPTETPFEVRHTKAMIEAREGGKVKIADCLNLDRWNAGRKAGEWPAGSIWYAFLGEVWGPRP
jgi:hypothetical protein